MYHLKQEKNNFALGVLTKKIKCAAFASSGKTAASRAPRSSPLAKRPLRQGARRDGYFRRLALANSI